MPGYNALTRAQLFCPTPQVRQLAVNRRASLAPRLRITGHYGTGLPVGLRFTLVATYAAYRMRACARGY